MENWLNLKGEAIHHIEPSVCKYPHQSDKRSLLQSFEAPENNGENIATRIRVRSQLCFINNVMLCQEF